MDLANESIRKECMRPEDCDQSEAKETGTMQLPMGNVLNSTWRLQLMDVPTDNSSLPIELPSSAHSLQTLFESSSSLLFLFGFSWAAWSATSPVAQQTTSSRLHSSWKTTATVCQLFLLLLRFGSLFGSEKKFDFLSQLKVHYHTSCRAVQVLHSCSQ